MFKQVLAQADLVVGPGLALILFFSVMCGAILWVFRQQSGQIYQAAAQIPFSDDHKHDEGT
ncbi:MAG: cbb3-type cytochrome c oxidase subunit 3 [Deltaproteobacteria bacterium]|nr:cbb3-type cytochrome c oxidase subunit 3 [Deltaproteobacteria bacterium]